MDLLELAEENFLISFVIVLGLGLLQGSILARGIRKRFPSLKHHARAVSILLLIILTINAIISVLEFATPEKLSISDLFLPSTPEEGFSLLMNILGLNAGFATAVGIFVSLTIILLFRFAEIPNIARYFIFSISVIIVIVAGIARFTDYVPTLFQIMMYAFYQFGLTIGIFLVTRRKEADVLSELE